MMSVFVVLAALCAGLACAEVDPRLYAHALSFAQSSGASVLGGMHVSVDAQFYLHGWDDMELRQCSECPAGKNMKLPCSVGHDTVCHDGPPAFVVYTPDGYLPFETDDSGRHWAKVIQMRGTIKKTREALGDIRKGVLEGDSAKVSDEAINSLTKNGRRVYRIKSVARSNNYAYIWTTREHDDMAASWGIVPGAKTKLGDQNVDISASSSGWSTFTQAWVDYHHTTPRLASAQCDRYFIGHGRDDCYQQYNRGLRCVSGGGSCSIRGHHPLDDIEVHILVE